MARAGNIISSEMTLEDLLKVGRLGNSPYSSRQIAKALQHFSEEELSLQLPEALRAAGSRQEYGRMIVLLAHLATDSAIGILEREAREQKRWKQPVFYALGMCRHPRAALVLLEWFHGPDQRKRGWAAHAMGRLADPRTYAALRDRYLRWRDRSPGMAAALSALPPVLEMGRRVLTATGMTPSERLAALEAARDLRGGLLFSLQRYLERQAESGNEATRRAAREILLTTTLVRPADRREQTDLRPAGFAETDEHALLRADEATAEKATEQDDRSEPKSGLLGALLRLLGRSDQRD